MLSGCNKKNPRKSPHYNAASNGVEARKRCKKKEREREKLRDCEECSFLSRAVSLAFGSLATARIKFPK